MSEDIETKLVKFQRDQQSHGCLINLILSIGLIGLAIGGPMAYKYFTKLEQRIQRLESINGLRYDGASKSNNYLNQQP